MYNVSDRKSVSFVVQTGESIIANEVPSSNSTENTMKVSPMTPGVEKTTISKEKKTFTSSVAKYKKVLITSVKNIKGKKVKLVWKKLSGVSSYQIQYATDNKFKTNKKNKYTNRNSYKIKKLKKKKTYYIRVRAYKLNGKKKIYGKWSSVKKVKIKK